MFAGRYFAARYFASRYFPRNSPTVALFPGRVARFSGESVGGSKLANETLGNSPRFGNETLT